MDEFGIYRNTKEDFEEIRQRLDDFGDIVFPYSYDQMGCMIIHISRRFHIMSSMPFGGNPAGRIYVGIYGRGCNHLGKKYIYPSYVFEKLNLGVTDADGFCELWNGVFGEG
jgi:hypothetical protein